MAVTSFFLDDPTLRYFLGLSTDSKPSGVVRGSRFYETDSNKEFIFDGTAWHLFQKYPVA